MNCVKGTQFFQRALMEVLVESPPCYEVFYRYINGDDLKDISKDLGISLSMAYRRVEKAKNILKSHADNLPDDTLNNIYSEE